MKKFKQLRINCRRPLPKSELALKLHLPRILENQIKAALGYIENSGIDFALFRKHYASADFGDLVYKENPFLKLILK